MIDGDGQSGSVDLGAGDDLLRIVGTTSRYPNVTGGTGIDTVRVENTSYSNYGVGLTGFEKLVLATGGNFSNFSGYQQIVLATAATPMVGLQPGSTTPGTLFNFVGSSNPSADLQIGAGQALRLNTSSLRSVVGSAGADDLTLSSGASVTAPIDLGGGDDRFTIDLLFAGIKPSFASVTGGTGKDVAEITIGSGQSLAFDLRNVTGFETISVNGSRQETVAVQLSHVVDATTLYIGGGGTLTLSDTVLPDALLYGAFGGGVTLTSGTVIDRYGFPEGGAFDTRTDLATRDPNLTVNFVNNGTVENNINFYIGNDTLLGGAGDEHFSGDKGNDVIDGGAGFDTAVFAGTLAQLTATRAGATLIVSGPDGTDRVTNVKALQFADAPCC